jgi:hypothetical protein
MQALQTYDGNFVYMYLRVKFILFLISTFNRHNFTVEERSMQFWLRSVYCKFYSDLCYHNSFIIRPIELKEF